MKKITNEQYRKFLDTGIIDPITETELRQALKNITGRHQREGRALLITLYYTGARPNEILDLKAKDITTDKKYNYLQIKIKGSKGGLPRTIYLRYKKPEVKELYNYAKGCFPEMLLFYHYRGHYERLRKTRKGEIKRTAETSDKLRYHLKKWFSGVIEGSITPYFLRHNRFSQLAKEGATMQQIRMMKGSKSTESVMPYLHLSAAEAKEIAKRIK